MKVKISTWIARGVTYQDLDNWAFQGLIAREYNGLEATGLLWTLKSPSKWPQEAKERYYATAGTVAKESGERRAAWNAKRKAEWAKVIAQYGKGVRQVHHTCRQEPYVTATAYVTTHNQAFNMDGTPHYCEQYLEPVAQSPADMKPKTDEYTYCRKCEKESGWTSTTQYIDLGICPACGSDCILPENHPVRLESKAWAEKFMPVQPEEERTETVIITTAPESYDYGYCVSQLLPWTRKGKQVQVRQVTVPDIESARYQTGRYRSGMYEALTPEEFEHWHDLYEPIPEKPFKTVIGLNITRYYFDTREGAERFREKSAYLALSPFMLTDVYGRKVCFEVVEHYYNKK